MIIMGNILFDFHPDIGFIIREIALLRAAKSSKQQQMIQQNPNHLNGVESLLLKSSWMKLMQKMKVLTDSICIVRAAKFVVLL